MQAFTIKTNKSDYPFMVIADGFKNAIDTLLQKGIYDTDIISVQNMESFVSDHIIIEESISQIKTKASTEGRWWPEDVDVAPVEAILGKIRSYGRSYGYAVRIRKIFYAKNIKTVGELLRVGRHEFKKYNQVGIGSLTRIDEALEDLYNIKGW